MPSPPGDLFDTAPDPADDWDKDDARRQRDQMAPPSEPCECHCLHCRRTFMSDANWFQRVVNDPGGFEGFWMYPTPNCGGAGFTFDIFPTDPSHPANAGWHYFEDDDDDDEGADGAEGAFDDDERELPDFLDGGDADQTSEWDPDEPKYKALDELYGDEDDDDDDLEGEEWKHGLAPGERPEPSAHEQEGQRRWEEEQLRFDQPDERPRELDWSDHESRRPPPPPGKWSDDDIPF